MRDLVIIRVLQLRAQNETNIFLHISIVRLYDDEYRIALIKAPRSGCNIIRAALTLLTQIRITSSSTTIPIVASTLSINGSTRTMKLATLRLLKQCFQDKIYRFKRDQLTEDKLDETNIHMQRFYSNLETKMMLEFEERMKNVQSIDA